MQQNLYRPLLRPAGFATLPRGLEWDYVQMPPDLAHRRPELPASKHRHGVIRTAWPLTAEECEQYSLEAVDDTQTSLAQLVEVPPG